MHELALELAAVFLQYPSALEHFPALPVALVEVFRACEHVEPAAVLLAARPGTGIDVAVGVHKGAFAFSTAAGEVPGVVAAWETESGLGEDRETGIAGG